MCCGSRRAALRSAAQPVRSAPRQTAAAPGLSGEGRPGGFPRPAAALAADAPASVFLRYLQAPPIRVWGPVTRRPYDFSDARPVQPVDLSDAAVLERSDLFSRV